MQGLLVANVQASARANVLISAVGANGREDRMSAVGANGREDRMSVRFNKD
jgi:hypothetical protein